MDLFKNRVQYAINKVGTATDLARKIGITRQAISSWAAGDTDITRERLILVADAARVYIEWLATGQGPRDKGVCTAAPVEPHTQHVAAEIVESAQAGKAISREVNFDIAEAMRMVTNILLSGTSYADALYLNIQHFDRAIGAEKRLLRLEEENQGLKSRIENLESRLATLEENLSCSKDRPLDTGQGDEANTQSLLNGTTGI